MSSLHLLQSKNLQLKDILEILGNKKAALLFAFSRSIMRIM